MSVGRTGGPPKVVVVMGVSGAGKTTIGQALATRLGWGFQDADDLHPRANILRMAAGHPLTEADRAPWLATLRDWVRARLADGPPGILAASLLKRSYRDEVIGGDPRVALVYLHGDADELRRRMRARPNHFMPAAMLDSQMEILEPPGEAEQAIVVDVGGTADATVRLAMAGLT